jgi:ABC-2 type transport system ATP-binding protein
MIDVKDMTLTYPSGKGVFHLDFSVGQGEVMGYLGPNGAGKTTTIRALLGFMSPNAGECTIGGLDCVRNAPEIQKRLGYIPGEISFFDGMTGAEFLHFMLRMRGAKDVSRQKELIDMFEFSPKGKIRKFSKGTKQKLGIVAAFMHDPDVLILDEPTSGLDPLMQARFVELVLAEKKRGKTILMSSHMFEEVEKTCDNVLIIKDGRIIQKSDAQTLKGSHRKGFILKTDAAQDAAAEFRTMGFSVNALSGGGLEVMVAGGETDRFLKAAARYTVLDFDVKAQTLEDIFLQFYGKEEK